MHSENDVEKVVKQFLLSQQKTGLYKLGDLLDSSVQWVHSTGAVDTGTDIARKFTDGTYRFKSVTTTDQTIVLADDLAVVRHMMTAVTAHAGESEGEIKLGVVLVWRHRHGRWFLLVRQAYKV